MSSILWPIIVLSFLGLPIAALVYWLRNYPPRLFTRFLAWRESRAPAALTDYRGPNPALYNWWEVLGTKPRFAWAAFMGFLMFSQWFSVGYTREFFIIAIILLASWVFMARLGFPRSSLKSATPIPPPPPKNVGTGLMRATMHRRQAVYSDGPRSEIVFWLQFSETARALIQKNNLLNLTVYRQEIAPHIKAELRTYGALPEGGKYSPNLDGILKQQPWLITAYNPLELDDIEAQIQDFLIKLKDAITNLSGHTGSSTVIDL